MGTFPIQANFLHVGDRRPLGVGAGSMALLAFLPEPDRSTCLDVTLSRIDRYPRISRAVLEQHIADARARGYVRMLDIVIDRIGAIGVPIILPDGNVVASISVAALSERIVERERELAELMLREARTIAAALT
jgi:DNA-binding IclR family transcriptional regulator